MEKDKEDNVLAGGGPAVNDGGDGEPRGSIAPPKNELHEAYLLGREEEKASTAISPHEAMRRKLWCDSLVTTIGLKDPKYSPLEIADNAIDEFDERFKG